MIMLLITIVLITATLVTTSVFYARYCFKIFAHKFYTLGELSPEFRAKFNAQLALSSLPCRRLVGSNVLSKWQGVDNRPVIYTAGEVYINEDICNNLSQEEFAAGLLYEQAHYKTGFYVYSALIMCIIFISCLPLVAFLNRTLQAWIVYGHAGRILTGLADLFTVLNSWPLMQFIILYIGVIVLEFAMGAAVVNYYAAQGYDLKSLNRYLNYVENTVSIDLNRTFNVSSNRKRCEMVLHDEKNNSV